MLTPGLVLAMPVPSKDSGSKSLGLAGKKRA
jgi:hypothetical protein